MDIRFRLEVYEVEDNIEVEDSPLYTGLEHNITISCPNVIRL